jgi:predicted TIM-barrel fold metal-dependent hydrolase
VGPADEGAQVHLGQHALADQPAVGLVVGLLHHQREFIVQRGLHLAPAFQAQPSRPPGVEHDARQHMRSQHVVGFQFGPAFQVRHARTQVGKLPRSTVHDGQRQARGDDFQFDGVVRHQAQGVTRATGQRQVTWP